MSGELVVSVRQLRKLQQPALPERLRVWEALDLFAALAPRPVDWPELLRDWGLEAKRHASFGSLSGGQRQRLFIALALLNLVFAIVCTAVAARACRWE